TQGRLAGGQFESGRRNQRHLGAGSMTSFQSQSQSMPSAHPSAGAKRRQAMLSRTADNLYWLARYVERAEYLARILEATLRLTALPVAYVGSTNEWETAVATAGCGDAFSAAYSEANEENVTEFLAFSSDNPSSIRNCIEIARQNARAVRTALTTETWETINGAWLELKRFRNGLDAREEFLRFL